MKALFDASNIWVHLGALMAFAFGAVDAWHFHHFNDTTDLLFIVAGLAALGVNLLNGTAHVVQNGTGTGGPK